MATVQVCFPLQLEHHIHEFRTSQDRLAEVREKYKQGSSSVNDLARELAQVTEELEGVKAAMDEKGTSMTDAGPLVRIKQSLMRLKAESTQMEVRIGVVCGRGWRGGKKGGGSSSFIHHHCCCPFYGL